MLTLRWGSDNQEEESLGTAEIRNGSQARDQAGNLGFIRAGGRVQQGKMLGWSWAETQDQFLENPGPGTVTWGLWYPLCSDTLGEHCLPKLWSWSAMTLSREGSPWPYSPRDENISCVTLQVWVYIWKDRQVEFSDRNKKKHRRLRHSFPPGHLSTHVGPLWVSIGSSLPAAPFSLLSFIPLFLTFCLCLQGPL